MLTTSGPALLKVLIPCGPRHSLGFLALLLKHFPIAFLFLDLLKDIFALVQTLLLLLDFAIGVNVDQVDTQTDQLQVPFPDSFIQCLLVLLAPPLHNTCLLSKLHLLGKQLLPLPFELLLLLSEPLAVLGIAG